MVIFNSYVKLPEGTAYNAATCEYGNILLQRSSAASTSSSSTFIVTVTVTADYHIAIVIVKHQWSIGLTMSHPSKSSFSASKLESLVHN